jgi:hypothetical protein
MRPHRRFAKTVAPRSLVTRHLPLPVHLKLHQRLPMFVSRRSSQMLQLVTEGEVLQLQNRPTAESAGKNRDDGTHDLKHAATLRRFDPKSLDFS